MDTREAIARPWSVIARAPLRIDLSGGFTDVPPFGTKFSSLHVSATVTLGVEVRCRLGNAGVRVVRQVRGQQGQSQRLDERCVAFVAALGTACGPLLQGSGVDLSIDSDMPGGTGLGSSGAILVAATAAVAALRGRELTRDELAKKALSAAAAHGIVGGRQDEFAAAFGGVNAFRFSPDGGYRLERFVYGPTLRSLEHSLLIVRFDELGRQDDIVADVARKVAQEDANTLKSLHELERLSQSIKTLLEAETNVLQKLSPLLARVLVAQGSLHPGIIPEHTQQTMAALARRLPGTAYKMTGGGGQGGSLLVLPSPQRLNETSRILEDLGAQITPVVFQPHGVRVRCAEVTALV